MPENAKNSRKTIDNSALGARISHLPVLPAYGKFLESIMNIIPKAALVLAGLLGGSAYLMAGDVDLTKLPPDSDRTNLTFDADIKPLFRVSCFACHSGAKPAGGLNLTTLNGVLNGGRDGLVLTAGASANSPLVIAISRLDPDSAMPPRPRRRATPPPPAAAAPAPGGGIAAPGNLTPGAPPQPPTGGQRRPMGRPLSAEEVGLVRAWIDQGAK
jgi:hypothetical protein